MSEQTTLEVQEKPRLTPELLKEVDSYIASFDGMPVEQQDNSSPFGFRGKLRVLLEASRPYAEGIRVLIVDNSQGEGDWEGIYINGELVDEGHSLDLWDVLATIKDSGLPVTELTKLSLTQGQIEDILAGSLPAKAEDAWAASSSVEITVNTRKCTVKAGTISYEDLAPMWDSWWRNKEALLTIVYRHGSPEKPDGSVTPGQSVPVVDGMIFNIADTSNA